MLRRIATGARAESTARLSRSHVLTTGPDLPFSAPTPARRHFQERQRRIDLTLENLGRGRPGPQDQLLVRVAESELDELLGDDWRRRGIMLFGP